MTSPVVTVYGKAADDPLREKDLAIDPQGDALEIDPQGDVLIAAPAATWTGQASSEG
jgi:hypothetical protein